MAKMTDSELKALLQAERNASLGGTLTSDLSTERAKAMDYYNGDMSSEMPAVTGQSKAVSRDVADTIEGLMPTLMEIFEGGEEVIKFEPVGQEDEQAAEQETNYVNHVYSQKNPGFLISYTFIKDALLSKNGIVKVYWDKTEREERETYLDQDEETFTMLASQPDVEIMEHSTNEGEDEYGITHDVTLVKKKSYGCCKIENVPPEEFGIRKDTRSLRDCNYCFHEPPRTEADLIAQGFDKTQVKSLPTFGTTEDQEGEARNILNADEDSSDTTNRATRRIRVVEHYVRMDYENDGKTTLYRVTTGGSQLQVLKRDGKPDVHPVDVIPFAAMTPVIMTHRFYGKSAADLVMDIQEIKTALVRGWLTNIYLMNNQRMEIAESHAGERTIDDILVNRPGGIVRTKQPGGLIPIVNQPIGVSLMPAIEYMDATREWRTGVTKQGQGLDPNALQNIGERAVLDAASAARAKTKLIARIFAETGFKDMFALIHGCIRKNDKQASTVRLKNKWVTVDPRNWITREDMTPTVGLGNGSRNEEAASLMNVLSIQKEMKLGGMPTVTDKNIYNTAAKLTERIGLRNPEPYFTDPESQEGQQISQAMAQRPDPEVMKIQMEAEAQKTADERKAQIETVQAQADMATNQQKMQMEAQMNEREFQLKKELALLQAEIEREKFNREEARKDREHEQKMSMAREQHAAGMQQTEMGMIAGREQHEQKMEQAKAKPKNGGE
jgi:hypothetical protein